MRQIKLAALLRMLPLALCCAVSAAQELNTPQSPKAEPQKDESSNSPLPPTALNLTIPTSKCGPPPTPRENEVYGRFVPYTGPLLGMVPKCEVATVPVPNAQPALDSASTLDLSSATGLQPNSFAKSAASALPKPAIDAPIAPLPAITEPTPSEYVRPIPSPPAATIPMDIRPFRSLAIGFKADTLGLGVEFATPMAYKINLRSSINFFAFNDSFSIDGVNYGAKLNLKSSETTVDWFPRGEGGFHISPGVLYVKNSMSAPAFVNPGQTFVLGTQAFTNSVDDPMTGSSSVVYPRKFAPLLLVGYGNIIPRVRKHFSIPIELGVAYTGAPVISVALHGTACTTEGCVNFAGNAQAQTYVQQEVHTLNEDLKRYPVFPIASIGMAYHF